MNASWTQIVTTRVTVPMAVAGIAALLVLLSLPRSMEELAAQQHLDLLGRAGIGSGESAGAAWADMARQLERNETPPSRAGLPVLTLAATAELEAGLRLGRTDFRAGDAHLRRAQDDLFHLLQRAPADANRWADYAYALYATEGFSDRVRAALRASYATGPLEAASLERRLLIMLLEWQHADAELRDHTLDQVAHAMRQTHLLKRLGRFLARLPDAYHEILFDAVEAELGHDLSQSRNLNREIGRERRRLNR